MARPDADIIVVGAGPAGSAAAARLAAFGHRVLILERARFPRPRIGESLPPKVDDLLQVLGAAEAVAAAGFARMRGTVVARGGDEAPLFHPFDPAGGRRGYQVERGRFDSLLLERARALGAEVRAAAAAELGWAGPLRQVSLREGGALTARFVVDASGAAGWGARALGLRSKEPVRTVALAGYWAGCRLPELRSAGVVEATATFFEMLPDGWIWSVLRQDGLRNVTLGLDAGRVKDPEVLPLELYLDTVRASALVGPMLGPARLEGGLSAHDATWTRAERFVADGILFAGDAAATIDPLTSQGVFKAMRSGIVAASVVNTVL
ncbi:MAG: tryptophan 7-halogenase, partial [Myxococcales bacterium]|nr:tryptophan 7-halogenase [Myxococcales bacterium]